jgi:integrase/recombinase XerD
MQHRSIPDIHIVPVQLPSQSRIISSGSITALSLADLREKRVEEFLEARSLALKSQRAYRQDLQRFLEWSDQNWESVTPRLVAQFKTHLLRTDVQLGKRVLADATVNRTLGTLKNFYGWMFRSRYVSHDPTTEVDRPKLKEPTAQNLNENELELIYQAAVDSHLPERNLALIFVLLHGLRASEVCGLNLADYEGQRLMIREAKADSKGAVPLTLQAQSTINGYLEWRQMNGELLTPQQPLFVSHSRRNRGQRLSYDAIRKVIDAIEQETGLDLHAHQFRHTFATNLVLQGMNPYHVMTLTRHKSVQSFRRYTKAADQAAAETAFYEIIKKI